METANRSKVTNTDTDLFSHSHRAKAPVSRWLIAAAVGTILVILGGGTWFCRSMQKTTRERVADELAAIAQLKAAQIADWRANQLAESLELTASPFFNDGVAHWLASPSASGTESHMLLMTLGLLMYGLHGERPPEFYDPFSPRGAIAFGGELSHSRNS